MTIYVEYTNGKQVVKNMEGVFEMENGKLVKQLTELPNGNFKKIIGKRGI